jgi:hypothetical protein
VSEDRSWAKDPCVVKAGSLFDAMAQGSRWKPGHAWDNVRYTLQRHVAKEAGLIDWQPPSLEDVTAHYWQQGTAMHVTVLETLQRIARSALVVSSGE